MPLSSLIFIPEAPANAVDMKRKENIHRLRKKQSNDMIVYVANLKRKSPQNPPWTNKWLYRKVSGYKLMYKSWSLPYISEKQLCFKKTEKN